MHALEFQEFEEFIGSKKKEIDKRGSGKKGELISDNKSY